MINNKYKYLNIYGEKTKVQCLEFSWGCAGCFNHLDVTKPFFDKLYGWNSSEEDLSSDFDEICLK